MNQFMKFCKDRLPSNSHPAKLFILWTPMTQQWAYFQVTWEQFVGQADWLNVTSHPASGQSVALRGWQVKLIRWGFSEWAMAFKLLNLTCYYLMKPWTNGRNLVDDIFKQFFLSKNKWISTIISLPPVSLVTYLKVSVVYSPYLTVIFLNIINRRLMK